ncbi:hypothetical protein [Lentzea sp. CC55]|uniref:hypothetical protein n=1 Tax=Lentzea sp. CC55 TaxID=2884909 RepID=UPI001F179220|nr:hypothetical protein [Lentzea sp. CC55]MCG8924730.1 hypothetical protein [Lentzea sp. CC55]
MNASTAGAVPAAAPAGDVSTLANAVPCDGRDDFFKIRYDPIGLGDFYTQCFANPGWVENGKAFWTIYMCAGVNTVDYDIGNIRTTLWPGSCRTINAGASVSRIYMR